MEVGRILIVEDDVLISEFLNQILMSLGHNVVGIVGSLEKTKLFLETNPQPDLALLDIRMHNEDQGVEVAKLMNEQSIPFIFITSFSDKETLQVAVEQAPLGYILKPFKSNEIKVAVTKVFNDLASKFLVVGNRSNMHQILMDEIVFFESENVYVNIYTENGRIVHRMKLSEIIEQVPASNFIRVHRSFVVNKNYIQKIIGDTVYIKDRQIPISRTYKNELLNVLK